MSIYFARGNFWYANCVYIESRQLVSIFETKKKKTFMWFASTIRYATQRNGTKRKIYCQRELLAIWWEFIGNQRIRSTGKRERDDVAMLIWATSPRYDVSSNDMVAALKAHISYIIKYHWMIGKCSFNLQCKRQMLAAIRRSRMQSVPWFLP